MRVLVISPFPVGPKSFGGMLRLYLWVKYLLNKHEVVLAYFIRDDETMPIDDSKLLSLGCKIHHLTLPKRNLAQKIRKQISLKPNKVKHFEIKEAGELIKQIIDSDNIDIVHTEIGLIANYIKPYQYSNLKKVLVEEEFSLTAMPSYISAEQSKLKRLRLRLEKLKFYRYEKQILPIFDFVYAINQPEKTAMAQLLPKERIGIFPNVVDADQFKNVEENEQANNLIFIGNYEHTTNKEGIEWFLNKVWPIITTSLPDTNLFLAGANSHLIESFENFKNVQIHGFVESLPDFLTSGKVFIAPIISGGGMRGKILEAMAAGKPVVTTSTGAWGIDGKNGVDLIIKDGAQEFAQAVCDLLVNNEKRRIIGDNGRNLIKKFYDYRVVFPKIEKEYEGLLK